MYYAVERKGWPGRPCPVHWIAAILAGIAFSAAGVAGVQHRVSQAGRAFMPGTLTIQRGDAIEFTNDDGDLLHHAYLDSELFSFDTGDQEPGSRKSVIFTTRGNFTVLCGIHPKMKLQVHVQ